MLDQLYLFICQILSWQTKEMCHVTDLEGIFKYQYHCVDNILLELPSLKLVYLSVCSAFQIRTTTDMSVDPLLVLCSGVTYDSAATNDVISGLPDEVYIYFRSDSDINAAGFNILYSFVGGNDTSNTGDRIHNQIRFVRSCFYICFLP